MDCINGKCPEDSASGYCAPGLSACQGGPTAVAPLTCEDLKSSPNHCGACYVKVSQQSVIAIGEEELITVPCWNGLREPYLQGGTVLFAAAGIHSGAISLGQALRLVPARMRQPVREPRQRQPALWGVWCHRES